MPESATPGVVAPPRADDEARELPAPRPRPGWFARLLQRPAETRTVVQRLRPPMPDARIGWLVVGVVTLLALVLRLWQLGEPDKLVFDEIYYTKDAWSILQLGYEGTWAEGADEQFARGDTSGLQDSPSFVVHPPLGKLLIGAGMAVAGVDPFGWRVMAAVFGALLVAATTVLAHRLSRSTLVAGMAGLLLAVLSVQSVFNKHAILWLKNREKKKENRP